MDYNKRHSKICKCHAENLENENEKHKTIKNKFP